MPNDSNSNTDFDKMYEREKESYDIWGDDDDWRYLSYMETAQLTDSMMDAFFAGMSENGLDLLEESDRKYLEDKIQDMLKMIEVKDKE